MGLADIYIYILSILYIIYIDIDIDIDILYIGWINNKILLYSIENYIQYTVINHNGKEYEKLYMCMCVCMYIYI